MEIPATSLLRHRPFIFAWAWEMACIVVAGFMLLKVDNQILAIIAIFAGVVPMAGVILVHNARMKAAGHPTQRELRKRSRDIVE